VAWTMFHDIKAALDAEDIEGLLAIGAPGDEYNGEASMIDGAIAKATAFGERNIATADVEKIICQVWDQMFGPLSEQQLQQRADAFRRVAEKLAK
jgi:hypothetical protein